jgi:hypothetical protein
VVYGKNKFGIIGFLFYICIRIKDDMKHYLFSQEQDMLVASFDKYDRNTIKNEIINHLKNNPTDVIEHCKDYTKNELKRFLGYKILNFYGVNPKSNKVSLIVTRNNKEFHQNIEGHEI